MDLADWAAKLGERHTVMYGPDVDGSLLRWTQSAHLDDEHSWMVNVALLTAEIEADAVHWLLVDADHPVAVWGGAVQQVVHEGQKWTAYSFGYQGKSPGALEIVHSFWALICDRFEQVPGEARAIIKYGGEDPPKR